MTETRRVTYEGSEAFASMLVAQLEEEGLEVQWTPPQELRHSRVVELVVIPLLVTGAYDVLKTVIGRFLERFPRARIRIEDDEH